MGVVKALLARTPEQQDGGDDDPADGREVGDDDRSPAGGVVEVPRVRGAGVHRGHGKHAERDRGVREPTGPGRQEPCGRSGIPRRPDEQGSDSEGDRAVLDHEGYPIVLARFTAGSGTARPGRPGPAGPRTHSAPGSRPADSSQSPASEQALRSQESGSIGLTTPTARISPELLVAIGCTLLRWCRRKALHWGSAMAFAAAPRRNPRWPASAAVRAEPPWDGLVSNHEASTPCW
jgi:hypothetical protein